VSWLAIASGRGARRHHFAVASTSLSLVLLLTAPATGEVLGRLVRDARLKIASVTEPAFPIVVQVPDVSLPEVKIPRVTFHKPQLPDVSVPEFQMPDVNLPDISIQWPAFVTVPIKRLDEMLAGPLVEPGARLLVADFETDLEPASGVSQALALVVESELSTARRFTILPRERALAASQSLQRKTDFALDSKQAVSIAAAGGFAGVVTGRYEITDGAFRLDLSVLDAWGEEVYRITSLGAETEIVDATVQAARDLRRRLGEPYGDSPDQLAATVLSTELPALTAYAEARFQLWRGRYWSTINSAAAAIRVDTAFAAAHLLSATAYALVGQRWRAQQALKSAWQYRGRLSERERLRLAADREVFRGRLSQAIADYDMLFSLYRNDVAALKSQAIVQRMIGARGHGTGNLRVAYSIDPVDWPPLRRVARFLGYRGRLPSIDQFATVPTRSAAAGPSD
jgi:tetratricopeptide (TPR) repeat protein